MKIIGVLGRPVVDDDGDGLTGIYDNIKNAIIKKGCIPFLIAPVAKLDYVNTRRRDIPKLTEQEKEIYQKMTDMCSGLIIPGGYKWFEYDEYVTKYAIEKNIPILGICMGMQVIASLYNNKKETSVNNTEIEHRQKNVKYVHSVNIQEKTMLNKIIGKKEIKVNSLHKLHITDVGKLKISAYSEDGLIEGIELSDKKFVLGVQWHPEKMLDYDEDANKIFDYFIKML